jgi:long-chain fatty acid transport protein
MGIIRFTATVFLLVALLCGALVASGFENTGVGTRARGMGGAFRAIADDWTAAYYNPAGYALIPDNQLGGNAAFLHLRDEVVPNFEFDTTTTENGIFNGRTIYNSHGVLSLPSAGFVVRLPLWGETSMGLSAYQPFDQNIRWNLYHPMRAYNDSAYFRKLDEQYVNNLDVVAFQLTAARELTPDKLSAGIGIQLLRGDLVFKNLTLRENPMSGELSDNPRGHIAELSNNDGNGWGLGLKGGLLWQKSEKVRIGFTASLPFTITIKGTGYLNFLMPHELTLVNFSDKYPVGSVGYLFVAGENVNMMADFETKLKLPPSFGAGISYKASDRLLVALDAEYTLWSRFDGFEFSYTNISGLTGAADSASIRDFFTSNLASPVDWKNSLKLAVGGSYDYNKYLTVVGGVSWDQGATKEETFLPQFMDTGSKLGFSAGAQVHISRWDLGLMTSIIHQAKLDVTGSATDVNGDGTYDNFPGQFKGNDYETTLSFNYRY